MGLDFFAPVKFFHDAFPDLNFFRRPGAGHFGGVLLFN